MNIEQRYSHLNGLEWLYVHEKGLWKEITEIIEGVDASYYGTKLSKEKGMEVRRLHSPRELGVSGRPTI